MTTLTLPDGRRVRVSEYQDLLYQLTDQQKLRLYHWDNLHPGEPDIIEAFLQCLTEVVEQRIGGPAAENLQTWRDRTFRWASSGYLEAPIPMVITEPDGTRLLHLHSTISLWEMCHEMAHLMDGPKPPEDCHDDEFLSCLIALADEVETTDDQRYLRYLMESFLDGQITEADHDGDRKRVKGLFELQDHVAYGSAGNLTEMLDALAEMNSPPRRLAGNQ